MNIAYWMREADVALPLLKVGKEYDPAAVMVM
jgi:hypothetical protein